ncbi:hypothetical protein AVEN_236018-1, partial [Araneus ventricosus]
VVKSIISSHVCDRVSELQAEDAGDLRKAHSNQGLRTRGPCRSKSKNTAQSESH